ncbi:Uncharacterised protein [Bordetella ansorpii]|uniref:Uncharacterized protein n=1 Tax=Bordetella ansorpii TaxID=288768 RepID=A0A157PZV6_9BORD|nr:Uncharacterised protein [Bordetella ansorpii]
MAAAGPAPPDGSDGAMAAGTATGAGAAGGAAPSTAGMATWAANAAVAALAASMAVLVCATWAAWAVSSACTVKPYWATAPRLRAITASLVLSTTRPMAPSMSSVRLSDAVVSLPRCREKTPSTAPMTSRKEKKPSTPNRLLRMDRFAKILRMMFINPGPRLLPCAGRGVQAAPSLR